MFEEYISNKIDLTSVDIDTINISDEKHDEAYIINDENKIFTHKQRKRFPDRHEIVVTANSRDHLLITNQRIFTNDK